MSKEKGTYLLFLFVKEEITLKIGSLSKQTLPMSNYIYVGSAFGPGGLKKRLDRHKRKEKRIFWHIDYLLEDEKCTIESIGMLYFDKKIECKMNSNIRTIFSEEIAYPIKGFGSSDCKCTSHLSLIRNLTIENIIETIQKKLDFQFDFVKA